MPANRNNLIAAFVPPIAVFLPDNPPTYIDNETDYNPDVNTYYFFDNDNMDNILEPIMPFCCVSAIPGCFRYIADLIPTSTTHNVLSKPVTALPLITAFLLHATSCYHDPSAELGKEVARVSAVNLYFAIVQFTIIKSVVPKPPTDMSKPLPILENKDIARPRRSSSVSVYRLAALEEDIMEIQLSEPSVPSQYVSTNAKSSSANLRQSIIEKEVKYFIPVENCQDSTILSDDQKLKGSECKNWKEIGRQKAMDSLRLPEFGFRIGDGETWVELKGMEKLVCPTHAMEFEIRAWIRET